ncbi:MAG: glycosyltransferase family 4 protein, partial [Actinomycetota bacterium]|nr:glycosyltransferase family 4 protein [Actinomycetota bacterium]
ARAALGLSHNDEVIINVARQEYQKGQRHLLEAVRLLLPTRPRLILLVAGRTGHASAELEDACRKDGLGGRVRLLGYRHDIPELLAAADVFAFPSLYEGLGGALIEAMALGLPVVASDLPAIREVVVEGGNAVLVPAGAPHELATAIAKLLEDPGKARAFGARSRQIFDEQFTMDHSARQMTELYHQVARIRDLRPALTGGRR